MQSWAFFLEAACRSKPHAVLLRNWVSHKPCACCGWGSATSKPRIKAQQTKIFRPWGSTRAATVHLLAWDAMQDHLTKVTGSRNCRAWIVKCIALDAVTLIQLNSFEVLHGSPVFSFQMQMQSRIYIFCAITIAVNCIWQCRASALGCLKHVIGGNPDNIAVVVCHPQAALPQSTFFCRQLCGRFAPRPFCGPGPDSSCNGGSGPGTYRLHWGKSWHKSCKQSSHPPPACALVGATLLGIASTRYRSQAWWPFGMGTRGVFCWSSIGNIASQFSALANTSSTAAVFQLALVAAVLVEKQLQTDFGSSRCTYRF